MFIKNSLHHQSLSTFITQKCFYLTGSVALCDSRANVSRKNCSRGAPFRKKPLRATFIKKNSSNQ